MAITGGFGSTLDIERGTIRRWAMGRDGVKRWADTGEAVDAQERKGSAVENGPAGSATPPVATSVTD